MICAYAPGIDSATLDVSTAVLEPARDISSKPRQLTVTTARRSIVNGSTLAQPAITSSTSAQQPDAKVSKQLIPAQLAARKQRVRRELPTVSSVSPEAIPGLRRQASTVDPEQAKQLEKGWGLAFKDPSVAVPVRKEVGHTHTTVAHISGLLLVMASVSGSAAGIPFIICLLSSRA